MATSASCSGDKAEPAHHITAPQCPLTEVLPLHLQHSFLFCPTCPMGITDILLSGSWCKPRLWLGEILNSEILNAIGFVPAHRTTVRFTGSAHSSQSCLFLDFSAHSLWAEREIDLAQLYNEICCSRVGVLQTLLRKGAVSCVTCQPHTTPEHFNRQHQTVL